jgi:hypothetical protein
MTDMDSRFVVPISALAASGWFLVVACGGPGPLEGRVSIAVGDDFENNRSEYFYGLTSDDGVYYEFMFDQTNLREEMQSVIHVCFGGTARVTGTVDAEKIRVRTIKFVDGPPRESTTEDRFTLCREQVGRQIGP